MGIAFGEFIKKHRLASGYKSQRQLAEKSGVSRTTISRMEKEEQRPTVETLKELAPHLPTTSLVELMVVAGYWDKDELIEPINIEVPEKEFKEKKTPNSNEKEFVNSLELSDDQLLERFSLTLDGKKLTEQEAKGVIAYLRSLRQMKDE